jgi:hypothetical protein
MHADASTITPAAGPGPPSARRADAGAVRLGQRDVTGLLNLPRLGGSLPCLGWLAPPSATINEN